MKSQKLKYVMGKIAPYLVLALCLIAVGLSITFMIIDGNQVVIDSGIDVQEQEEPKEEPKILYYAPVLNAESVLEYSESVTYNSTLNRFSVHLATDYFAEEGAEVYCMSDGVIESVENSLLQGITVTVDHGNGLKTVYNSLEDGDFVKAGQSVKGGEVIGQISNTNRTEYKSGAHLHFEVLENGKSVNPDKYLSK